MGPHSSSCLDNLFLYPLGSRWYHGVLRLLTVDDVIYLCSRYMYAMTPSSITFIELFSIFYRRFSQFAIFLVLFHKTSNLVLTHFVFAIFFRSVMIRRIWHFTNFLLLFPFDFWPPVSTAVLVIHMSLLVLRTLIQNRLKTPTLAVKMRNAFSH